MLIEKNIAGYNLRVEKGFKSNTVAEVVKNSLQPRILSMAPRDASERFVDEQTAMDWYHSSHDRQFYSLRSASVLAGIIWFTKSALGDAQYTFAIRMYEPFIGKGMAIPFADATHQDLENIYKGSTWADININNLASRSFAYKLGYRAVDSLLVSDPQRVQMVRPGNSAV